MPSKTRVRTLILLLLFRKSFLCDLQIVADVDPQLKRQVEVIRNLVESYMSIITKSTKDLVPKVITHMILKDTKKYIFEELLVHVYATEDQVRG